MRYVVLVLLVLAVFLSQAAARAQEHPRPHSLSLDVSPIAVGVGYARMIRNNLALGLGGGIGADYFIVMVAEGDLFPYSDRNLFEYIHGRIYAQYKASRYWLVEGGVRGAAIFEWYEGEPWGWGGSLGVHISPLAGSRNFRFGCRVVVGILSDAGPEVGVMFYPLVGRITFEW